jgi:hypothetical protein
MEFVMEANYIDLPTVLIYLFWIGFALLIIYLRREDKRVGYPLESDRQNVAVQGFPAIPAPRAPRAKHPALEGSDAPMHQQPSPADGLASFSGQNSAISMAYLADAATRAPAAPPSESAAAPAHDSRPEPTGPREHHSDPSDEELDR